MHKKVLSPKRNPITVRGANSLQPNVLTVRRAAVFVLSYVTDLAQTHI